MARFTYTNPSIEHILITGSDYLAGISLALFIQHILTSEKTMNLTKERRNREEFEFEAEKNRVLGELAAGMVHEIRNPLTSIRGFLQLSKANGYSIEPWYDLIYAEVSRLNELTIEYLQISKPSEVPAKRQNLHDSLIRVVALTEAEAQKMGHRIVYEEFDPELTVPVSQEKLIQVFMNLIKNAMEAMPEQGTITIQMTQVADMAVVIVKDTGTGVQSTDRQRIFSPYYTTKNNGTGLGLYICHKIIVDHGGTMSVSGKQGEGATFTTRIPLFIDKG
ncbi:two-component system sensor histidine kinase NtrB [Gorillibacterium massiliense]|uniref:two-component system sensor histidine kinase NtrB n=1 Tax=Gorillibacterium massiliense TaxID=1280390 RepID=UPI001EE19200|nr:ATP-binding protein [Gorillibacterium massiliense]